MMHTTCSPQETSNSADSAVVASLDNLVISRMRNSALQKWQQQPHATSTMASSQSGSKSNSTSMEHGNAHEDSFYLSCPLCFEDKSKQEVCTLSQCSHEFCRGCLVQWTQRTQDGSFPSCPLCRCSTTTEDMEAILGQYASLFFLEEDMSYGSDDDDDDDEIPLTISPRLGPIYDAEDPDLPSASLESRFSFMGWI